MLQDHDQRCEKDEIMEENLWSGLKTDSTFDVKKDQEVDESILSNEFVV